ncbi:MAG TPA: hypothetical protein PK639_02710 [Candidatus Woesebacteria bacterium]|nr:hypothetical protein [Candidatus Woesebacteria bacterium]
MIQLSFLKTIDKKYLIIIGLFIFFTLVLVLSTSIQNQKTQTNLPTPTPTPVLATQKQPMTNDLNQVPTEFYETVNKINQNLKITVQDDFPQIDSKIGF